MAITAIVVGAVLIHTTSAKLWFLSLVLWIFAGVMLAKVKYERYTFDKQIGTVRITRRGITGTRIKTYYLSHIKEVELDKERDLQGGDHVALIMRMENGKEVKLVAGHFCGIRAKLKKLICNKLRKFLHDKDTLHKTSPRIQILLEESSVSSTSSSTSSESSSYSSSSSSSSSSSDDSSKKRKKKKSRKRSHSSSDATHGALKSPKKSTLSASESRTRNTRSKSLDDVPGKTLPSIIVSTPAQTEETMGTKKTETTTTTTASNLVASETGTTPKNADEVVVQLSEGDVFF